MSNNDSTFMKLYRLYIDQKKYLHAVSCLLHSGIPHNNEYWKELSSYVEDQSDLYWFCCVHSGESSTNDRPPSQSYLEVYNQLPTVPSILAQYLQSSKEKQNTWSITIPTTLWEDISWKIPILLFEDNTPLLLSWLERLEHKTLESIVLEQMLTHLSNDEHFDFLCALYLWKKTWHTIQPTLLSNLGTWALEHWECTEYPISSKTVFFAQISSEEKIRLADALQVHLYDIEDHAFVQEIETRLIENNRSSSRLDAPQSLYGVLPILDDLGYQATDSTVSYLLNHVEEYPNDVWAKATLVFVASSANNISSEHYLNVRAAQKQLTEHFPQDSLIQCFNEQMHSPKLFLDIFPSKQSIGAHVFLQPNSKALLGFYASECIPEAMYQKFCIQQNKREAIHHDASPSLVHVLIITVIAFAICLWLLGSVLSQLL